jgi:hypothetical protein|tara:strand:+ start:3912 stop:4367 length:456 start_codon:yes stop_codon:yes gene_type:complete
MSQRRDIIKTLIDNLILIDGTGSPFGGYVFKTSVHENVYRGFKPLEEINDFPSIYIVPGAEIRDYNSTLGGTTINSLLPVVLRCYIYDEEDELVNEHINDITQDIEHIIYSLPTTNEILDLTLTSINTDEGLLTPYGIVELQVQVRYEVTL